MSQHQADLLRRTVYEITGSRPPLIIDSNTRLDDMMRQVSQQVVVTVDCMTMKRLATYLSEDMKVIMWGGYLGEELKPYTLQWGETIYDDVLSYVADYSQLYYRCFDLLDRHEGETPNGVVVDTLVAPYLALVIPQSNS